MTTIPRALSAFAIFPAVLIMTALAAEDSIQPGQNILPPAALTAPLAEETHPLAKDINQYLVHQADARDFSPTGLNRQDYLKIVSGMIHAFRKYVDEKGELHDPVAKPTFYSAPHYAHCVATLAAAGYEKDPDIIASGMRALDYSLQRLQLSPEEKLAQGLGKQPHSDFFIYPAVQAFEQFSKIAPKEKVDQWTALLRNIKPATYDLYKKFGNNWSCVHGGGEFLRATHGFTNLDYVEEILENQKIRRTKQGLYMELGAPLAYDGFPRYFITGMLERGYHGANFGFMRDWMWQGAWTMLMVQSPFGEMPTEFRSAHHIWNEAETARIFEVYASQYAKANRLHEASAFKRGAHLALQALSQWIRPDGSGYIVKNRYPIEAGHAYHNYSTHTNYNMLAMSMLCAAYTAADDSIAEKPAPADVGGFVVHLNGFNVIVANCDRNYVEYLLRGNQKYNPTGILRVHLHGSNPQIGPSDGVMEHHGGVHAASVYAANKDTVKSFALGPAWLDAAGSEVRLAGFPDEKLYLPSEHKMDEQPLPDFRPLTASLQEVSFQIVTDWPAKSVKVTETIHLTPDGLRVENAVDGPGAKSLRLYFPMLVTDGAEDTKIAIDGSQLTLHLRGAGETYSIVAPEGAKLQRLGTQFLHWNGMMEPVYADLPGLTGTYTIEPAK